MSRFQSLESAQSEMVASTVDCISLHNFIEKNLKKNSLFYHCEYLQKIACKLQFLRSF